MKVNPYQAVGADDGTSVAIRRRPVGLILATLFSLFLCLTPSAVAAWAWRAWWRQKQVPGVINSFPIEAFAWQVTILSVVCCVGVGAVWLIVLLKKRQKQH